MEKHKLSKKSKIIIAGGVVTIIAALAIIVQQGSNLLGFLPGGINSNTGGGIVAIAQPVPSVKPLDLHAGAITTVDIKFRPVHEVKGDYAIEVIFPQEAYPAGFNLSGTLKGGALAGIVCDVEGQLRGNKVESGLDAEKKLFISDLGGDIKAGSLWECKVSGIQNPEKTGKTETFTILTKDTNGVVIDSVLAPGVGIVPRPLTNTSVIPASLIPGVSSTVAIKFTTAQTVPGDGKIEVTFPNGFNLSENLKASEELAGNACVAEGVLKGKVSKLYGNLNISNLGNDSKANTLWECKVSGIQNPQTPGLTGTFAIKTTDKDDNVIDEDLRVSGVTITPYITNFQVTPKTIDPSSSDNTKNKTAISFTLNADAELQVKVTGDPEGNNIENLLLSGQQTAKTYLLSWDGTAGNSKVADGTYYVFVEAKSGGVIDNSSKDQITIATAALPKVKIEEILPSPFSPNGDGKEDYTNIKFTTDTDGVVQITIIDNSNNVENVLVAGDQLPKGSHSQTWFGKLKAVLVADGDYTVKVKLTANNQNALATKVVKVMNAAVPAQAAPKVTITSIAPNPFSPDGDGLDEETVLEYDINVDGHVQEKILDKNNVQVISLADSNLSSGHWTTHWDGKDSNSNDIADGIYTYEVTFTDKNNVKVTASKTVEKTSKAAQVAVAPLITNFKIDPGTIDPNSTDNSKNQTNIDFSLNTDVDLDVKVTSDANGNNLIKSLFVGTGVKGTESIGWNGKDSQGTLAPNGTYYVFAKASNVAGEDTKTGQITVASTPITEVPPSATVDPSSPSSSTTIPADPPSSTITTEIPCGSAGATVSGCSTNIPVDGTLTTNTGTTTINPDQPSTIIPPITIVPVEQRCAGFIDVANTDPVCAAVKYVKQKAIFEGYEDNSFQPYRIINRAEMVKVTLTGFGRAILQASNLTNDGFIDADPNAWYMPYIHTAKELGIIEGYADDTLRPEQQIIRVEMLKVFFLTAAKDISRLVVSKAPYRDTPIESNNDWYIRFVQYSKNHGLVDATADGLNFYPAAGMRRGDVAQLFYRYYSTGLNN